MQRRILIAIVSDERRNDACLSFVTSFLKLQSMLFGADVAISVVFSNSEREMLEKFHADKDFDAMLYLDSMIGFNPEMAFAAMTRPGNRDVILGTYPLPAIHWDRLEKYLGKRGAGADGSFGGADVPEDDLMLNAMTFNVECHKERTGGDAKRTGGDPTDEEYAIVDAVHDMKVYAISRRVVDSYFDPANRSPKVFGWDGPMYCDVERQCSSFGNLDHVGCVGHRSIVR